jgi:tripartite-type tricarboxylate transporter receptor subunit TctC
LVFLNTNDDGDIPMQEIKRALSGLALSATLLSSALAQSGPIKLIVGFPAGGSADATARAVADKVAATLGTAVVVENKPGAGGRIAAEFLKNAPADGNTVLITPLAPVVIAPLTFRKLPYNPAEDFVPVAHLAKFHLAISTAGNSPHKNLGELVAWFKANPSKANFGTSAAGSQLHFLGVMLGQAIGQELTHVPYQGGAPLNNDIMGGQIPAGIDTLTLELHKAGKMRMLAVSGETRSGLAPDVPTFKEQGFPAVVGEGWMGAYMHAKTPAAVVAKVSAALADAARAPDVKARLEAAGVEPTGLRAAEFAAIVAADRARWKPVVEASGFKGD